MAKKKQAGVVVEEAAPYKKPEAKAVKGRIDGMDYCQKCDHSTPKRKGAGVRKCANPDCGEPLPKKEATTKKPPKGNKSDLDIRTAISAVKELGGLDTVKALIQSAEKALEVLKSLGGIEAAKASVTMLDDLRSL